MAGHGRRWLAGRRGVEVAPQLVGVMSTPMFVLTGTGALGPHLRRPTVEVALLHLELGDAVARSPPMRSARSNPPRRGRPGQLLGRGGPAGPEPTTATFCPS
jgi:hypothetical protein